MLQTKQSTYEFMLHLLIANHTQQLNYAFSVFAKSEMTEAGLKMYLYSCN